MWNSSSNVFQVFCFNCKKISLHKDGNMTRTKWRTDFLKFISTGQQTKGIGPHCCGGGCVLSWRFESLNAKLPHTFPSRFCLFLTLPLATNRDRGNKWENPLERPAWWKNSDFRAHQEQVPPTKLRGNLSRRWILLWVPKQRFLLFQAVTLHLGL